MYTNPDVLRGGLEAIAASGPVKIQGEYATMNFRQEGRSDKDIKASYIGISYMLTGEKYASSYKGGVMDRMTPNKNYTGLDSAGYGAWEIGARYSKFNAGDFTNSATTSDVSSTASTNKADSYTVGIKWIPEPNTRFLLDYVYTDFNKPILGSTGSTSNAALALTSAYDTEKAINMRAQFDF